MCYRSGGLATILSSSSLFAVVALISTATYGDHAASITAKCRDLQGKSGRDHYHTPFSGHVHRDWKYSPTTRNFRMEPQRQEYKGHHIELRARDAAELRARGIDEREEELELLIDDQPVRYGQFPDGQYFLQEYAYDWTNNLMDLTKRFIDYRDRADKIRRETETGEEN